MKKGFTLIELLGVLVVLGVLAVITVPLIQGLINGAGDDSKNVQEEIFIKSAKTWAGNNAFSLPDKGEKRVLLLQDLIDSGYLEANKKDGNYYIKKSNSNKEYKLESSCVIITNSGDVNSNKYEYKFSEEECAS